jgi:hypothetical protein
MTPTTKNQIEDIRKACVEANPDILKLEFGCEVEWDGSFFFLQQNKRDAYMFFSPNECDTFCVDLHIVDNEVCEDGFKIIGRPIRLADILVAISKRDTVIYSIHTDGTFLTKSGDTGVKYNLPADDITLQSPETISFIHNLLYGK